MELTDEQIELLIDHSDGHWREDTFRIDGPSLTALLRAAAKAASADVDGEAIWQRFIDHLNAVEPIVFKKADGQIPHTAFLGSIEKYKRIFIESQRANSPRGDK